MEKTMNYKNGKKRMILIILALVGASLFAMLLWIEIGGYTDGKTGILADIYLALTKNPSMEIRDVKLGRYITTVEEAVEIAEQYSLSWDERVVTGAVSIHYKSKDDLINNTPDFRIHSGWNSERFSDGSTHIHISGDMLIEFTTYQSATLTPSIPLIKSESYLTNYDFMDFLDKIALEKDINWREFEDVKVIVSLRSNDNFSIDLRLDGSLYYEFLYKDGEVINLRNNYHGNRNSDFSFAASTMPADMSADI